jgi:diguanylate cyclase (GGDEF)-like protein/PAS domain S-box-containing protein
MNDATGSGAARPGVLVVNDREDQRVAIGVILASLGVVVTDADSGRAALRAVLRDTFALVLMDVRMPGMDGYETAKLIRQRPQTASMPIIFLTAFGREDTEALAAYASGAVDFISTPVDPDVLRAKVSFFVGLFVQSEALRRSLESITELNAAVRDSEASTQAVLDHVADGILTADEDGLIESLNRSARELFGYSDLDVIGQPLGLVVAPASRAGFHTFLTARQGAVSEAETQSRTSETVGCRRDGSTFEMEVEPGEMKRGKQNSTLLFVRDISERKAYTKSLEHQALHDALTGLTNRTLFAELANQALAAGKRTSEPRAVLVMDLNGFKQINDTLGHDHGDALLKQLTERLVAALRETDTIARIGGDEFAILPGSTTDLTAAAAVAWKIEQTCKTEFVVNDHVIHISASVGIAMFPEHGVTTGELLRHADAAMYGAKRSGSGQGVFDAASEKQAAHRLALLVDLRRCIDLNQLVLHYQPVIDLKAGEISGVEALIRWHHPVQGLLLPASFMAEVERTELITAVTRWVLGEALRQQAIWRDQGIDLTMGVNISARSLDGASDLPDTITELTQSWSTAPDRLILELTEGALIKAAAPDILGRLHAMGERVSIDDFGTGYSSLAYLQRLQVDELKIDRSFVSSLSPACPDAVIVRSTIELAHNLGLTVVAEGVEDEAAVGLLHEYGCDRVQGYLFSRPCPAEELSAWLTESRYTLAVGSGAR